MLQTRVMSEHRCGRRGAVAWGVGSVRSMALWGCHFHPAAPSSAWEHYLAAHAAAGLDAAMVHPLWAVPMLVPRQQRSGDRGGAVEPPASVPSSLTAVLSAWLCSRLSPSQRCCGVSWSKSCLSLKHAGSTELLLSVALMGSHRRRGSHGQQSISR